MTTRRVVVVAVAVAVAVAAAAAAAAGGGGGGAAAAPVSSTYCCCCFSLLPTVALKDEREYTYNDYIRYTAYAFSYIVVLSPRGRGPIRGPTFWYSSSETCEISL